MGAPGLAAMALSGIRKLPAAHCGILQAAAFQPLYDCFARAALKNDSEDGCQRDCEDAKYLAYYRAIDNS